MKRFYKNRIKLLFVVSLFFSMISLFSQPYSSIEDVDILEQQKDVLRQKYEHTFDELEILGGDRLDEIHTMIAFKKDGVYHEAVMNSERKEMMLVAVAAEIPDEDVPQPVMNAFKNGEYGKKEIIKTFLVDTPYGENFYAIDITLNGEPERLYYDELGARQNPPY